MRKCRTYFTSLSRTNFQGLQNYDDNATTIECNNNLDNDYVGLERANNIYFDIDKSK